MIGMYCMCGHSLHRHPDGGPCLDCKDGRCPSFMGFDDLEDSFGEPDPRDSPEY